jgi:hypothetical protein
VSCEIWAGPSKNIQVQMSTYIENTYNFPGKTILPRTLIVSFIIQVLGTQDQFLQWLEFICCPQTLMKYYQLHLPCFIAAEGHHCFMHSAHARDNVMIRVNAHTGPRLQSCGLITQCSTLLPCYTMHRLYITVHLCGILSLAIHISPNNGPIDLFSSEEMIVYVLAIHFAF